MADTKQSTRKSLAHTGIEIIENTELEWEEYRPLDDVTRDDVQADDDDYHDNEWESVLEDAQDEMETYETMRSGCYTDMLYALNRNALRRNECDGVHASAAEGDKTAAALLAQLKRMQERKDQDRKTDRKQLNDKDRLGNAIPARLVSVVKFKNLLENMEHARVTLEEMRPEAMHAARTRKQALDKQTFLRRKLEVVARKNDAIFVEKLGQTEQGQTVMQSDHIGMIHEIIKGDSRRGDDASLVWERLFSKIHV